MLAREIFKVDRQKDEHIENLSVHVNGWQGLVSVLVLFSLFRICNFLAM